MKILYLTAIGAISTSLIVFAAERSNDKVFQVLDKNNDGFITKMEASSVKRLVKDWKSIDKDNNGNIEAAEFAALKSADVYIIDDMESEHIGAAPTD